MSQNAEYLHLFLANIGDIRAFLRTVVRNPRDLEDVLQSVALVLWGKFDQYDRERPFGAWARGVAAKEVLTLRRNAGRYTSFSPEVVALILDAYEARISSMPGMSDRIEALEKCLENIPKQWREAIDLRYGRGMALNEIAKSLGHTLAATQRSFVSNPSQVGGLY